MAGGGALFGSAQTGALLHQAERGAAFVIERHDFAVQHRGLGLHGGCQILQFRKLRGQVVLRA